MYNFYEYYLIKHIKATNILLKISCEIILSKKKKKKNTNGTSSRERKVVLSSEWRHSINIIELPGWRGMVDFNICHTCRGYSKFRSVEFNPIKKQHIAICSACSQVTLLGRRLPDQNSNSRGCFADMTRIH